MPKPVRRTESSIRDGRQLLADLIDFLGTYMVMTRRLLLVAATWVIAAWLIDVWDRFPHMAVSSPGMRSGKTTFLKLLQGVTPNPYLTPNASAAAIYRLIESEDPKPTFLIDESQSLGRLGSESAEVLRELFNSAIDKNAKVIRCAGDAHTVVAYSLFCPKVLAFNGDLDAVLADRCLPIRLSPIPSNRD